MQLNIERLGGFQPTMQHNNVTVNWMHCFTAASVSSIQLTFVSAADLRSYTTLSAWHSLPDNPVVTYQQRVSKPCSDKNGN